MSTKVLIDTNIYAAHEMGYPDAVEFIEQLIEDEAEIIMTTLIGMEIMSHFEIETDPDICEGTFPTIKSKESRRNGLTAPFVILRSTHTKTESHAMTLYFYKSRQSSGRDRHANKPNSYK